MSGSIEVAVLLVFMVLLLVTHPRRVVALHPCVICSSVEELHGEQPVARWEGRTTTCHRRHAKVSSRSCRLIMTTATAQAEPHADGNDLHSSFISPETIEWHSVVA